MKILYEKIEKHPELGMIVEEHKTGVKRVRYRENYGAMGILISDELAKLTIETKEKADMYGKLIRNPRQLVDAAKTIILTDRTIKLNEKYMTGCMPHTDFRYEEFEGLLGSFYLSLLPLKNTGKSEDKRDYQKIMQILNGFAQRYGVQSPKDAVKNPRAEESWGNASVLPTWSMYDIMGSFCRDFGVGAEPYTQDQQERYELGRTILKVFDRYRIAQVGYEEYKGKRVPVKLIDWNIKKSDKTLADILKD